LTHTCHAAWCFTVDVQILTVIFNLIYIGFALDHEVEDKKPQATGADVEAPQAPKK
jgi:hypothetical protein